MRQSNMFIPTLREVPSEAEIASHQLLLRGGYIRQIVSGVYSYLPLAHRILLKIQQIVREEMNRAGAQELLMPAIQPADLWKETGRWDAYGPELMRLKDRHDRQFALGPTHEEVITSIVRDAINTYKKLPVNLYQIQTKFRDEVRPRFGVLRAREFIMKDAYSFDTDREGLEKSFQAMYEAYKRIFERCGVEFRAVEADAGAIGGSDTYEFMVLSEIGEDTIAYCQSCSYAANLEKAEVVVKEPGTSEDVEDRKPLEKVHTPDSKTIEEVADYLKVDKQQLIKSLLFKVDGRYVLALVRGDHELNDVKLKNLFGGDVIEMATDDEVRQVLNAPAGFLGPVQMNTEEVTVAADHAVRYMVNAVTGGNEKDYHYVNVNIDRDFKVEHFADLRNITEDDSCPKCGDPIRFARGIEVGHVFKLGTKYSEALDASFLDEQGKKQTMLMGCYGIGISRTMQAIAEQLHDENGIQWPWSVAPFHIHVIPVNVKQDSQREAAETIYQQLSEEGYDVLLDDRQERAGVKFNDADLIGIPVRITVGGKIDEGLVELKSRRTGETQLVSINEISAQVRELVKQLS